MQKKIDKSKSMHYIYAKASKCFQKKGDKQMRINRKKLIVAMLDADLNQKQLAELVGVSRATINNVSCGRSCSDKTAYGIAKALNVKVEQIME